MTSTGNSILVSSLVMAVVMFVVVVADKPSMVCNVGISELAECLPAIRGEKPSWPTKGCCRVMHKVDLPCLCNYRDKFLLYGIKPENAMALPKKCGLKLPAKCGAKH